VLISLGESNARERSICEHTCQAETYQSWFWRKNAQAWKQRRTNSKGVQAVGKDSKEKEEVMPYSKYSPKQKRLAAMAKPRKKITSADLKAVKKAKKKKR